MTDRNTPVRGLPPPPVITLASRVAPGAAVRLIGSSAPSSGATPFAANDMLAFPFVLTVPTRIYKGFWLNGSSVGGNMAIAVYNADYTLLAQSASTAAAGSASVPQAVTFDVKLPPGMYYCALAHSSGTTNRFFRWAVTTGGASFFRTMGCWRQASVTLATLPNPATPASINIASFPVYGLITRSNFDV